MDATTIYFVRHLAYADMIIVVCFGVPIFLVHLLDGWKLGKIMCTVSAYSFAILPNASLNFTALVGLHRLLRCTIPQKLGCLKKGHTTIIAWVTWFVAVLPGIAKMVHRPKAHFLQYWATCYFDLVNKSHPAALTAVSSVFIAIPSFIMVGSNIALILMSIRLQRAAKEKTGRRTSKGSNKVVYYISILYFAAWVPYVTSEYLHHPKQILPNWAYNFLNHSFLLQNVGNPIIYMIVNREFNKFISKILKKQFSWCKRDNADKNRPHNSSVPSKRLTPSTVNTGASAQDNISNVLKASGNSLNAENIV